MYFKQLDIIGFKSFPHKTKLKFEPGITAVVGPNGCGKSNISDAIRWVLGEQSAKCLRGSSMEDVIFNGTDSVEPINMAEVSLTLSNNDRALPIDYDEVTISRRLFRSGESEYVLNKTPVRLKDIAHLLMGTGMGTSSYSIIEQGKIDLILSSRPEERRYIFEEAAGITRYKAKKKEALKKLEHTENNLVRLGDIVNEVRKQISSIERHAKKAERYKNDFEVMKNLDLKLTGFELSNINAELTKNKEILEEACAEEEARKAGLEESLASISKCRQLLDSTMRELVDMQSKLSEARLFIDKGDNRAALNRERINDLSNFKMQSEEELSRLEERVQAQEKDIAGIRERFESMMKAKTDKEKTVLQMEENSRNLAMEISGHQKDIKSVKAKSLDLLAVQTKTKNELIKMGADLANRKTRLRRLETEKRNVNEEEENVGKLLGEAESAVCACREKLRKSEHFVAEIKNRLSLSEERWDTLQKRIRESLDLQNSLGSKEEILKEMIEKHEGFGRGVKLVMASSAANILPGVLGIVANIVEPETGLELALEAALGGRAQAIVAENRDALKGALRFLGEEKAQASFLIHEDIKKLRPKRRNERIVRNFGASQLSSLVRTEPSYAAVVDYLLGDIYLVKDLEEAYRISESFNEDIKFVTKEGLLFEKGRVFGGFMQSQGASSIIGRAKRLEEIRSQIGALKAAMSALKAEEIGEKKGIEGLKKEVSEAEKALKGEEINLESVIFKKESREADFRKIADELSIMELEIREVGELVHELSFKGDNLNVLLNEKEIEYERDQAFISSSQEALQTKDGMKNELAIKLSEIKSELAFLKAADDEAAKSLDKETRVCEELRSQRESKKRDARDSEQKKLLLEIETGNLEEEIAAMRIEEEAMAKDLSGIMERKGTLSAELQEKEGSSRREEKYIENLRNEIRRLEIAKRESELMSVNIVDRIRQAYKLDIQSVRVLPEEDTNWEEVKNQVEVLKIKLEKLGPVNLVAIEEHKNLEERFSFLTGQQEDLLRAKESLHKAILKINKTTKQLFVETFEKIQGEFKNYFRMLFGGGHAEVLLLDESDVLESGVEIVVRPPGKKLQNLLLLSGGEKALTAMALLFAVFKVKPSPFCILDEVDAPLDESNIGRFTRILQDFLKTSQFIIITHSKRTMQMANVLYGITMQQKGVSKIVSVKFAEDEPAKPAESEGEQVFISS